MKSNVKKLLVLFLCICMLMSGTVYAQESGTGQNETTSTGGVEINKANFPDDNFRDYVSGFDTDKNGKLSESEIDAVTSIDVSYKSISDLKGIEYFITLEKLNCSCTELAALDLSDNVNLTQLDCYESQLKSLDISKNVQLTQLFCQSNQLTDLDVSNNEKLTVLWCYDNQLTALDVSRNVALIDLWCYMNQLGNLDVRSNVKLTELRCYSNQLTALDVSKNVDLDVLMCGSNQLSSLDVRNNEKLTDLDCEENKLTSLDISKNINLASLFCYDNKLGELDVSKNLNLTLLYCNNNQLTTLDVRDCTKLEYLDVRPLVKVAVQYAKEPYSKFLYGTYTIDISSETDLEKVKPQMGKIDIAAIYAEAGISESANARVVVKQEESESQNRNFIINHASGFGDKILKVYDVVMNLRIDGQPDAIPITDNFGKLTLSFYAGTEYARKAVTIYQLHENADGTNEVILHKNLMVGQDGMVTITVEKLSTFGLSLQNTTAQNLAGSTTDANNRPNTLANSDGNASGNNAGDNVGNTAAQTGDSANMTVWVALMMLTMTIIPIVAILGRRQKR